MISITRGLNVIKTSRQALSAFLFISFILSACGSVDLNAPMPTYDTGVDSDTWAAIPSGPFYLGQAGEESEIAYDYEMMITGWFLSRG